MLSHHPVKENRRAWWNSLNFPTKRKRVIPYRPHDLTDHPVFGKSLNESLTYVSVQISTADANGNLYVWGYIPVVVAKCGLYLKENATEVPGTFRVNGSNRRMRELQAAFEMPPRYGKNLDWRKENYTTHDVASVFRRYLTQMPEPVIPYDMYHLFRDALAKQPFNEEEVIATYKSLIRKLPKPNQYLLLYVLDLLSVFARKSEKNLMTATNLAVIFRPGLISHPQHEMSPQEYELSQRVLEFLIAQQDWFMLDISPPTPGEPGDLQNNGGSRNAGRHERFGSNNGHRNGGTLGVSGVEVPSSPGWNENPEAGPSTPRQRSGSIPAWSSAQPSPPGQQINTQGTGSHNLGQLTEQITPVSSVPPSPTTPHFERSKASPVLPSIIPEGPVQGVQHQRRPSNLVHQMNRPRSHSPPTRTGTPGSSLPSEVEELMVIPSAASIRSAEEEDPAASLVPGGGGWKIVGRNVSGGTLESGRGWRNLPHGSGGAHAAGFMAIGAPRRDKERKESEREEEERIKTMRRRTTMERSGFVPHGKITIIEENPSTPELTSGSGGGGKTSIQRSRTLPSRRKDTLRSAEDLAGASTDKENEKEGFGGLWGYRKYKDKEKPEKRVLKKQRRTSGQVHSVASTSASAAAAVGGGTSNAGASPFLTPAPGMQSSNRTLGTSSLGTQTGREDQPSGGSLSRS